MTTEKNTYGTGLFETGDVIDGKWILIEQIGEGGMGRRVSRASGQPEAGCGHQGHFRKDAGGPGR